MLNLMLIYIQLSSFLSNFNTIAATLATIGLRSCNGRSILSGDVARLAALL